MSERGISVAPLVFSKQPVRFCLHELEDLGNMILHSEEYQKLISNGMHPGRFVSIQAAEYLSGLPKGWTCPAYGSVSRSEVLEQFPDKACGKSFSCCSCHACYEAMIVGTGVVSALQVGAPLKAISLFSGVGGLDLGLKQCPFQSQDLGHYCVAMNTKQQRSPCSRLYFDCLHWLSFDLF